MSEFIINFENSSDYSWDLQAIVHEHTKVYTMPKQDIIRDVSCASNLVAAPKRRRNKHKKTLVQEAKEDRVLSDKWNWRKYGEKAIKGSPYPRSYYRCSNSDKCIARKQVEQSYTNPRKFLITYIDEHNHPYPSRRPSQAGRSSRSFRASPTQTRPTSSVAARATAQSSSITEDKAILVQMDNDDNVNVGCVGQDQSAYVRNNCIFEDDFFEGLDYLDGLEMDLISHPIGSYCYQFPFPFPFPSNVV